MPSAFEMITRLLTSLTEAELDQVRARITVLIQTGPGEDTSDGDWLAFVVRGECDRMGLIGPWSPVGLRKHRPMLLQFLKHAGSNRAHQQAMLQLGINLLYQSLRQQGVPVTRTVLLRNLGRLPAVIDAAFPGYAQEGLLELVLKSKGVPDARKK